MLPAKPFNEKLILASKSPRRAEILHAVGWPFEAMVAGVDETRLPGEDATTYVRRLAQTKAEVTAQKLTAQKLTDRLVLGADTVVVVDKEIMGQPHDTGDAIRMLQALSGKWHEVLTGVAIVRAGAVTGPLVDHETTRVRFCELSAEEIEWYVSTGEPMGKAGAYAIQGRAALFIEQIQGDYFNIVGLPIKLVYKLASKL